MNKAVYVLMNTDTGCIDKAYATKEQVVEAAVDFLLDYVDMTDEEYEQAKAELQSIGACESQQLAIVEVPYID